MVLALLPSQDVILTGVSVDEQALIARPSMLKHPLFFLQAYQTFPKYRNYQLVIKGVAALCEVPVCLCSCNLSINKSLWPLQLLPYFSFKSLHVVAGNSHQGCQSHTQDPDYGAAVHKLRLTEREMP